MYSFEAKYQNMENGNVIVRKITFDGDNFFDTEEECYIYAMNQAFDMKEKDECLYSLEFISC